MTQTEDTRFGAEKVRLAELFEPFRGRDLQWEQLFGGLAHVTYAVRTDVGERYVVKFLTQEMDDFGLMIPIPALIANTAAAGESGIGARVLHSEPDLPAIVLEFIDGRTLTTEDLAREEYIPRIGTAIRGLHEGSAPMVNDINIFKFLDDYLGLVAEHDLEPPDGQLDYLATVREIQAAVSVHAGATVPSNNDLLAKNVMDDGSIRLIDYDFSGMNDPMFDVGDVAMEGDYDPDQVAVLCEAYFGRHDPLQYARARLYAICAQYTWSLLFLGMDALLSDSPDQSFDYHKEAVDRWHWTRNKLDVGELGSLIDAARG